jgi:hypothetical protein
VAIAGGACTAYECRLLADGTLTTRSRSALRSYCADLDGEPEDNLRKLRNGEPLTVAGSDMVKLRQLLASGNPPTVAA